MLGIAKIANDEKQKGHTGIGFLTGGTIGGIGGYMAGGHLGAEKGREEYRIPGMFRARDEINKKYDQKEGQLQDDIKIKKQQLEDDLRFARSNHVATKSYTDKVSNEFNRLSRMSNQEVGDKRIKGLNPDVYFNTSIQRRLGMKAIDADHIEAQREHESSNDAINLHNQSKDRLSQQMEQYKKELAEREQKVSTLANQYLHAQSHDPRLDELRTERNSALGEYVSHPAYLDALEEGARLGRQRGGIQGAALGMVGLGLAGAAIGHERKQTQREREEGL